MAVVSGDKLSWQSLVGLAVLSSLVLGLGLGSSTRLTYHEAFVAQGAREILSSGHWSHPTIGGIPWLEKPPLPFWLVAGLGYCAGGVNPWIARLPSAVAAVVMVIGVALLACRRYGSVVGILAGAIQLTTAWTVRRGRLAEADILLACMLVWVLLSFDRIRGPAIPGSDAYKPSRGLRHWQFWRWAFFALMGATTLVKGTGFGAALGLSAIVLVLFWDGDHATQRRLLLPMGWLLVLVIGVAWPLAMIAEHGVKVVALWVMHITARLGSRAGHGMFAGEPWGAYGLSILAEALPWTPLVVLGAWPSVQRALHGYRGGYENQASSSLGANQVAGDRLLCSWALAPLVLVSLVSARNAHYAIYALVPWSIWAALGLIRLASWQVVRRRSPQRLRYLAKGVFSGLALVYGLSFWLAGPWFDQRGTEWVFYKTLGHGLPPTVSLILLYDDWDRDAYPTPFGLIPHDLAVRLFYLNHPACWHSDAKTLVTHRIRQCPRHKRHDRGTLMMIIGRERDLPALKDLGQVEVLSRSPAVRWDRTYVLVKLQAKLEGKTSTAMQSLIPPLR